MKDQMQYLIWILGIIIAGAGAILAFLGLNTRKSVDEAYKQTYSKLVAAKDTEVFKKQIVFLYTKNNDIFTRFQNEIRDRGHNTKVSQVSAYAISKMSDAAIVVYHVSDASDTQCQVVAKSCDLNNIHCIFYCPTKLPDVLFRELNSYSYVSTSLQIAKLRESLFTLLYLTP
jgi:predicted outer membrane lipoprotein